MVSDKGTGVPMRGPLGRIGTLTHVEGSLAAAVRQMEVREHSRKRILWGVKALLHFADGPKS